MMNLLQYYDQDNIVELIKKWGTYFDVETNNKRNLVISFDICANLLVSDPREYHPNLDDLGLALLYRILKNIKEDIPVVTINSEVLKILRLFSNHLYNINFSEIKKNKYPYDIELEVIRMFCENYKLNLVV